MAGQWVRIDVGYLRNPKIRRVGPDGALVHLAAILYLGEHERGTGLLPPEAFDNVAVEARVKRLEPVIRRLVAAGLWHPSLEGGGFVIHDYNTTNGDDSPARTARDRKREWRDKQAKGNA